MPKVVEDALAVIGKQVIERSKHLFVGRWLRSASRFLSRWMPSGPTALPVLSSRSPTFSPDIIRW